MLAILAGAGGVSGSGAGCIEFTVLDDLNNDDADNLGTCRLPLAVLAEGDPIYAKLPLVNDVDRVVGQLSVVVRWRHPFRTEKELGPNALAAADVHEILSRFSPEKDGLVDWRQFIAWADPPAKVQHAVSVIRECAERLRASDASLEVKDMFDHLNAVFSKNDLLDDERTWRLLRGTVTPDELEALFHSLDVRGEGLVDRPLLLHFIQPSTHALLALERKVRAKIRGLRSMGTNIAAAFASHTTTDCEGLTRPLFKVALREAFGFDLVNEPVELRVPAPINPTPQVMEVSPLPTAEDIDEYGTTPSFAFAQAQTLKRQTFEEACAVVSQEREEGGANRSEHDEEGGERSPAAELVSRREDTIAEVSSQDALLVHRVLPLTSEQAASSFPEEKPENKVTGDSNTDYGVVGMPIGAGRGPPCALSIQVSTAEDLLFGVLHPFNESAHLSLPDLRPDFDVLSRGNDTVLPKQFLHVISQRFGDILVTPEIRQQLAAFFLHIDPKTRAPTPEALVDFRSFLYFLDYRAPEPSPTLRAVERMAVDVGIAGVAFREHDQSGHGVVSVQDFTAILTSFGQDIDAERRRLPLEDIAQLFCVRHEAVDWVGFLGYAKEHSLESVEIANVEESVRNQVSAERSRSGVVQDILATMLVRDRRKCGVLDVLAFEEALGELGVTLSSDNIAALSRRFSGDPTGSGRGILYAAFAASIESRSHVPASLSPLSASDKRRLHARALRCIKDVFTRHGDSGAGRVLMAAFERYDYRKLGVVGAEEFVKASIVAGFAMTRAELFALGEEFLAAEDFDNKMNVCVVERAVHYQRFLSWAMTVDVESVDLEGCDVTSDAEVKLTLETLRARIVHEIEQRKAEKYEVWKPFEELADPQGCMERRDFRQALNYFEVDTSPSERRVLEEQFSNGHGRGLVDVQELIRFMCVGQPQGMLTSSMPHALGAADSLGRFRELAKTCISKGLDFRAAFDRLDPDCTGLLTHAAFRQALHDLHANFSETEVSDMETRFQSLDDGGISIQYLEMLHLAQPGAHGASSGEEWRHEEKLRKLIKKRFQWWVPGKLRKCFKHFDQRRRGHLTEAELSEGLKALKFRLSAEQEHHLFQNMDLDGDGFVNYADLVVFVRDPNHRHISHRLRSELNKNQVSASALCRLLEEYDTNRSKLVGPADFGRVLRRAGCLLSDDEVKRLQLRFDVNEDGNLSIERIMAFMVGDIEAGGEKSAEPPLEKAAKPLGDLDSVLRVLKRELRLIGKDGWTVKHFSQVFDAMDPSGHGEV
jgi:Ca2+-binding EF-hand superfamily protein